MLGRGWILGGGRVRRAVAATVLAGAAMAVAAPASANPLTDCFERIAVATRHVAPHRARPAHPAVHRVRHVGPRRPRPHKIKAARPPEAYAHRTHYVLRPRACGTNEAQMSPLPGLLTPDAPELLLAEIAGPPPRAAAPLAPDLTDDGLTMLPAGPGVDTSAFNGPEGVSPGGGFVFPGSGGPGGPGGPGQPGQPPTGPDNPPVNPPPVNPPPVGPPDGPGQPPILPPGNPIIPGGPGGPGGPPGGPTGVPEPATWAMLTIGFFGLGAALRRRRRTRPA